LTFNYLPFDPKGVRHHDFIYTTLSHERKEKKLFFHAPLNDANFKVDKCVSNKMQQLKK
jgi:hypothetical protein